MPRLLRFPIPNCRLVVDEDDNNLVMDFSLDPEGGASGEPPPLRGGVTQGCWS